MINVWSPHCTSEKTPLKVNTGLTFSLLRLLFSSPIFPRSPFSEGLTAPANLTYWDTVYTNSYSSFTDITCIEATVDWFDQALQALTKIMNQHSNITCIYIICLQTLFVYNPLYIRLMFSMRMLQQQNRQYIYNKIFKITWVSVFCNVNQPPTWVIMICEQLVCLYIYLYIFWCFCCLVLSFWENFEQINI